MVLNELLRTFYDQDAFVHIVITMTSSTQATISRPGNMRAANP